ncbi:alpha/beta-hydrolase [Colletotrichum somersetense]|nr:alpha/beta-hydrolase [Colletotrichum somersetense]
MTAPRPQLSLWEKRDLVFRLLFRAPLQLLWNFAYGMPFAAARGVSVRFFAICAYYRFALGCMRARELQFLLPPSIRTYEKWIANKSKRHPEYSDKLKKHIEMLPANDGSIMWIGNRQKATKFVLFFHGGGYVVPLLPGHLEWCWESYINGGPGEHAEVAVAVLQYTLVPEARYPTQLRQAIAALNQLILSGIEPRDLIIGGDSAGGNLACSVIRHICHPCHLEIPALRLETRLAGVFLASPWLTSKTTGPSFKENNYVDMVTGKSITRGTIEFLHPRFPVRNKSDESDLGMAMPMDGDLAWVDDISMATASLYITAGQQEALRDDIRSFSEHVSCGNNDLDLLLELSEHEAHDFILLEGQTGRVGDATIRMRNWAAAQLGTGRGSVRHPF